MDKDLINKISPSEIISYIKSMNNTNNIGTGLVLLPRSGAVTLDFSNTNATSCTINFKRESGNGLLFSNVNNNNIEYQITSKTVQSINFDLGSDKIIRFNRTTRSRGNVIILDISLWGESLQTNWNEELKKSKEHGCLRLVGNELFASEGAYIKGTGIQIKTDPPNVCTINGEGIKFNSSCKIIKLNILDKKSKDLVIDNVSGNVIFDTNIIGFNRSYCNNYSSSTFEGVLLDNLGSYTIPLNVIKQGCQYSIRIFASKIDGNGKLMFGLIPENNTSMFCTVGSFNNDFVLKIVPEVLPYGYSLSIWRPPSSTGKIKINRIIVEELFSQNISPLVKKHFSLANSNLKLDNIKNTSIKYLDESNNNLDKYELLSKYFSIFPTPIIQPEAFDINGSVGICGFKARQWFNRLQTMFPNIKNDNNSNTLICDINNISEARRIWIDAFYGDKRYLLDSLNKSEIIFTPSLNNKIMLQEWFPNIKVVLCDLPLPKINDKQNCNNNYLYIENDRVFTEHILNIWDNEKLCLIGTKSKIPEGMSYLSEYIDYSIFSQELSKCKGLVDLTVNTNFKSNIVDLALSMGVPVITNNVNYIGRAKVVRHTISDMITKNMLNEGLLQMFNTQPDSNHNNKVVNSLKILGIL